MATKKNNILQLEANENNIKTRIKDKKKQYGKKSKSFYYDEVEKILQNDKYINDKYNNNFSFNNENRVKLEALKGLVNNLEHDIDNDGSYPELFDLDLSHKLYHKKEFHQYKLKTPKINNGSLEKDINKLSKKMCNPSGHRLLSNPQKLLKNYISPYTPYNGLLIYHGVGVGKTCTAVTVAEGLKEIIKGNKKKIYVLLNPSIKENFKNEILNKSLIEKSIEEAKKKCTGESYFMDGIIKKGLTKKKNMSRLVDNILGEYYEFYGYMGFVTKVNRIIKNVKSKNPKIKNPTEMNKRIKKRLKEYFSDSMIIIDEAHNIACKTIESGKKEDYQSINIYENINVNENKSINENKSKNESKNENKSKNNNKNEIKKEDSEKLVGKMFTPAIKNVLRNAENLKLILLTATPMYNEAFEIVDLLNLLLLNDKIPLMKQSDIFDKDKNLKSGGEMILRKKMNGYISYLRSENPINFPYKIYPLNYEKRFIRSSLYPKYDKHNEPLGDDIIKHLQIIGCEMRGLQLEVYKKYYEESNSGAFDSGAQICNMVYGDELGLQKEDMSSASNYYGSSGFHKAIDFKDTTHISCKINEGYEAMFDLDNLEGISCKIHTFISGIMRRMPNGIIFVYSQFKYIGIYPLAIFLELMGIFNYSGNNILKNNNVKPRIENGKPLKYLMKTGDSSKEFDNYKNKDEVNNIDGGLVKFILGTRAASEGISIYNVREIHILDPWFHLNRIEQINGRGIRNCSHKFLPLEKRNVTIYMYAAIEPKETNKETSDLRMYKISEKKAINMGKIQRIIKSSAIDCYLNKEGNNYMDDVWDKNIQIVDSRGNEIEFNLADKPFTDICNYSTGKKCEPIKCFSKGNKEKNLTDKIDDTTYIKEFSIKDIEHYQNLIKNLFINIGKEEQYMRVVFRLEDIKDYIKENDKMDIYKKDEILYFALDNLIKQEIEIKDMYNRPGRIINKRNYYIFQPIDLPEDIPIVYRRLEYKHKINKVVLKNLVINKTIKNNAIKNNAKKEKTIKIKSIKSKKNINKELNDSINLFCKIGLETEDYFYNENEETKKKKNIKLHLDFLEKSGFIREMVIIEYQYDNLSMSEKENIVKFLITKIKDVPYNSKLLKDLVDSDKINPIVKHLNVSLKEVYEDSVDIVDEKLNYLIKYCLYNHLEFNRQEGYERNMDIDYLGYMIYSSKTISRKIESKLFSYKLYNNKFINSSTPDRIILDTYHENYKLTKYRNRDLADMYGLYFCDRIKFKLVDNRNTNANNRRTLKPGVGCENSATTNRKLLIPLMKTLKDGDRLLNDAAKQKYKCLVIELFFRYKEHMSQMKDPKGDLYFYNQGLNGVKYE